MARPPLQQSLRSIADWMVPPRVFDLARDARNSLRAGAAIRRNASLRGRHADRERCFVIGNGPSLGAMDLAPLEREITIGANSFYKHPQSRAVGLKYLCIGDPDFMVPTVKSLEWHRILDAEHPDATFFAHPGIEKLRREHGVHARQEVYTFALGRPATRAEDVNLDLTRPLNVGRMTGSQLAIPLAIFLGAKRIVLIGFDLSHLADPGKTYHFYENHAQFPQFDSMANDQRFDQELLLEAMHREFQSHRLLRERSEAIGVRIVNATAGGRLDVYPRVTLADELAGRRRA